MKKKIGLSVSFCIADIIKGKVKEKDVEKIIGSTAARNDAEWEGIISDYKETYWKDDPEKGEAILRRLLKAGKIEQPRLQGKPAHNIASGHWQE